MIGASTERRPGSSDRRLNRHQKNRRPAEGLPIIPRHSENTITANAGRCASCPRPGRSIPGDGGGTAPPRVGKILPRTNLSGYARAPRLPPPQLRANAYTASPGAGGNAVLTVIPAGCSSPGEEVVLKSPCQGSERSHPVCVRPPTPLVGPVEKAPQRERAEFHSPLEGGVNETRAKPAGELVGGAFIRGMSSHRFSLRKIRSASSTPPQGGSIPSLSPVGNMRSVSKPELIQQPLVRGAFLPPPRRGYRLYPPDKGG